MILPSELLAVLWILFMLYWLVSATQAKKSVRNSTWWKGALFRVLALIVIIIIFQLKVFQHLAIEYAATPYIGTNILGIILCILGLALAVWARIYLGRNWGMPMSVKENAELVMTGPYKFIRHPIYAGIFLAVLGSALVDGPWWLIFLVFYIVYFVYSAKAEEKIMTGQFPNEYPAYKKRTKMLIPFIF